MKSYETKKVIRQGWKKKAIAGFINDADGSWINRQTGKNSMHRDYYPQKG